MESDVFGLIRLNNSKALHQALQQTPADKDKIEVIKADWPGQDGEIIGKGSPLHYATLSNRVFCVMVLLKAGANQDIKFVASNDSSIYSNKTAAEIAKSQKSEDILGLLNSPSEHRTAADELYQLRQQVHDLQTKYNELSSRMDEKDAIIRELQRFVKGEQKRKGYARS